MSIFEKFEHAIESSVNSVFSKFGSKELKPVDIMSALKNEIDQKASSLKDGRVEIPNHFTINLSSDSYDKVESWGAVTFADELTDALGAFATSQGYTLFGPIKIKFQEDLEIGKGKFAVSSVKVPPQEQSAPHQPSSIPPPSIQPLIQPEVEPEPIFSAINAQSAEPENPTPAKYKLVLGEEVFELKQPTTILGRDSKADIVIHDKGISREHLEFKIQEDGQVVVTDLNSTNGLYVEGHHTPAALLQHGNIIKVGRTKLYFYEN
jgi:hypothetical protein